MQFPLAEQRKRLTVSAVSDRVACLKHRLWCKCRKYEPHAPFLSNDLEVTGTPCQDYSPMGSRNGIFGKQFIIFITWVKVCKHQRPKIIVHENVPQFPVTLLHEYFSDDYWIFCIETDAQDLGLYAMSRPRSYAIMYDKLQINVLRNPSELFAHLSQFVRAFSYCGNPNDLFVSNIDDLRMEMLPLALERGLDIEQALLDWTLFLTVEEKVRLQGYLERLDIWIWLNFNTEASVRIWIILWRRTVVTSSGYQYLDAELDSLPLTDWVYGEATLDMMLQGHPLQFSI